MQTAIVDGIEKYYDEVNEIWVPRNELPGNKIWNKLSDKQQKLWLNLYSQFKQPESFAAGFDKKNQQKMRNISAII